MNFSSALFQPHCYTPETGRLLKEIEHWLPILRRLNIDGTSLNRIAWRAKNNGASFKAELLADGAVSEAEFYQALADEAGVLFLSTVDQKTLVGRDRDLVAELGRPNLRVLARFSGETEPATLLIAPQEIDFKRLQRLRDGGSELKSRIAIVAPSVLRAALMTRVHDQLTRSATHGLFDWRPDMSARFITYAWQAFLVGLFVAALPPLFWLFPVFTFIALHIGALLFFTACGILKMLAVAATETLVDQKLIDDDDDKPVYSILVALYQEAEIAPQLLVALSKIVWPRHRLEIKLICERDDIATLRAIRAHQLRSFVEVIEVPPSLPRTKPKALRYALPLTCGEFIVIYDAEDRPHPYQLLQAWQRFRQGDAHLACLQAPLEITNGSRALLARMFAVEYAGLFRGVLPWLSGLNQVFPLGGTSNHFRRAALEDSGGWDPHNVTEDADLGVRLARHRYRAETITLPTFEAAPDSFAEWRPQRTRWLKGWLQTWLVHMRYPYGLMRDLGPVSFMLVQVLLAGMAFSIILHPIIFLTAIAYSAMALVGISLADWQIVLLSLDFGGLAFSYFAFLWLGWKTVGRRQRAGFWQVVLATPIYWMMLSYAGWCAVWELVCHPHRWNKTPHKAGA